MSQTKLPSTFMTLTAAGVLAASLGLARPAAAQSTYLALGDSLTRGETDLQYVPTAAPGGYVSLYAAFLAGRSGGVAPTVVDLGIDGETAESFFSGSGRLPPVAGRGDGALVGENLNYSTTAPLPQYQQFLNTVASQKAAGNSIGTVTITLGTNDLLSIAGTADASTPAAALAMFQTNYGVVLSDIRQALPSANLLVLSSYNPFPADPTSPGSLPANTGGQALNIVIQGLAARNGATYVDIATPFKGNEVADTYLASLPHGSSVGGPFGGVLPLGNIHPNAAGYQLIAAQVEAAPEPSGLAVLGVGALAMLGLVSVSKRRKRAV